MSKSDYTEFIARISMGKDSLKMLDVIWTRGLPLDRITTTDVWATDTIPAYLPPMQEFRDRMDDWIWTKYRIECEHLCAMNKDGTKKTYEQMFYHIPNRRSQSVQVERERERERERDGLRPGSVLGFPDLWAPWCQAGLKRNAKPQGAGNNHRIPSEHPIQLVPETQARPRCHSGISVFGETVVQRRSQNSCSDPKASRLRSPAGARSSRSIMSEPLSQRAPHEAQEKKYRGISGNRCR